MICQKIALIHICLLIKGIVCKAHHWTRTLKTAFENLYIKFLNTDFSVNIASISLRVLGNALYNMFEGSVSQNFDLGPG